MKVKVLLVPFFLLVSVMLIIWLVYPAFSDLQLNQEKLKNVKDEVADVELKLEKTLELTDSLTSKTREQGIIYGFLPDSQKEEEVIDILNNVVYSEGLSISDLTVDRPKVSLQNVVSDSEGENGLKGASSSKKISNFEANLIVSGNYEKIRNVIDKVNKIKRFNNIMEFKIIKSSSEGVDPNSLSLELVLNFNYLERVKTIASVNNQIFTSGEFNMASVIENLEKYRTGYSSSLSVDGSGRSNPFVR